MARKKKSVPMFWYECPACKRVKKEEPGKYWCPCYPSAPFRMSLRDEIPVDMAWVKKELTRLIGQPPIG